LISMGTTPLSMSWAHHAALFCGVTFFLLVTVFVLLPRQPGLGAFTLVTWSCAVVLSLWMMHLKASDDGRSETESKSP
jgi:hypothetical protein